MHAGNHSGFSKGLNSQAEKGSFSLVEDMGPTEEQLQK